MVASSVEGNSAERPYSTAPSATAAAIMARDATRATARNRRIPLRASLQPELQHGEQDRGDYTHGDADQQLVR